MEVSDEIKPLTPEEIKEYGELLSRHKMLHLALQCMMLMPGVGQKQVQPITQFGSMFVKIERSRDDKSTGQFTETGYEEYPDWHLFSVGFNTETYLTLQAKTSTASTLYIYDLIRKKDIEIPVDRLMEPLFTESCLYIRDREIDHPGSMSFSSLKDMAIHAAKTWLEFLAVDIRIKELGLSPRYKAHYDN